MLPSELTELLDRGWGITLAHGETAEGICTCGKPDCQQKGKHLLCYTHDAQKEVYTNPDDLARALSNFPLANPQVFTDTANLVALDLDGDAAELFVEAWVKEFGVLLPCPKVKTPHGEHWYFRQPEQPLGVAVALRLPICAAAIDVFGLSGSLNVPPSPGYSWIVPPDRATPPPLPEALADMVRAAVKDCKLKWHF